ncbi:site-specific integrase [Photobacterium leiognathi]|uniref:tyrosine-type recombinase/integrase n=1 Tax=Photobacterium leiognathi TaxID=553611 RepID=UPI000D15A5A5|nr:tyrosine-type recombinase/integrase [Photobacterium leiognathi]
MIDIFKSIPRITTNPYVFAGNIIGKPISRPQYAYEVIKQRANIKNPEEVVLHTARHSVASNLISNGADITQSRRVLIT